MFSRHSHSTKAAVAAKNFFHSIDPPSIHLDGHVEFTKGNASSALSGADVVVEGTASAGNQHHFYMETQAARACPQSGGGMLISAGTQCGYFMQTFVSAVTGIAKSKVEVCFCVNLISSSANVPLLISS